MTDCRTDKEKDDSIGGGVKRLRFQEPDIVVAVGDGDNRKEFLCYAVVLGLASQYFEAMLSTEMKEKKDSRIEFPDKDPEEWKLFYSFIDPATSSSAKITNDNVKILIPWFHEFQMEGLIKRCDENILHQIKDIFTLCSSEGLQPNLEMRHKNTKEMLNLLRLSDAYNLDNANYKAWMGMEMFLNAYTEIIDYQILNDLLPLVQRDEFRGGLSWQPIRQYLPEDFDVDNDDLESTSTHNAILIYLLLAGMKEKLATKAMRAVFEFPDNLYYETCTKSYAHVVEAKLKNIIYEKWKNNGVIEIPEQFMS